MMMKKYVGPMGCVKPQDQPGNCSECGMKPLPTDQFGFEMDQCGSTTTDQYGFKTDKYIKMYPKESVSDPHISAGPHISVPYPHKSVGTYLCFIEGHISIMALLFQKCLRVHQECLDLNFLLLKFIQSKMIKI